MTLYFKDRNVYCRTVSRIENGLISKSSGLMRSPFIYCCGWGKDRPLTRGIDHLPSGSIWSLEGEFAPTESGEASETEQDRASNRCNGARLKGHCKWSIMEAWKQIFGLNNTEIDMIGFSCKCQRYTTLSYERADYNIIMLIKTQRQVSELSQCNTVS